MRITTCTEDDFYTLWNFSNGTIPIINFVNSNGTMGTEANKAILKLYPEEMFEQFLKWINSSKKANYKIMKFEGYPPLINIIDQNHRIRVPGYRISKTLKQALRKQELGYNSIIAYFDDENAENIISNTWYNYVTAQKYYPSITRNDEE